MHTKFILATLFTKPISAQHMGQVPSVPTRVRTQLCRNWEKNCLMGSERRGGWEGGREGERQGEIMFEPAACPSPSLRLSDGWIASCLHSKG